MKGMKTRILKKLKSMPPQVPYLKHSQILLFSYSSPSSSPLPSNRQVLRDLHNLETIKEEEHPKPITTESNEFATSVHNLEENKENVLPTHSDPSGLSFRRPDPNSATLFDPNLLAAFHEAVKEHYRILEESKISIHPSKVPRTINNEENENDPLAEFVEKCPPNGRESIVLYTTSLRGIRKTFEDCSSVRLLLENMRLVFVERDLSMHNEYREDLWRVLEFRAIPPRLFIKGRYIGGADEVLGLHEQGKLLPLVKGMARNRDGRKVVCEGCGGMRFRVCCECNGGRKLYVDEDERNVQCRGCNENGLVVCALCC